MRKTLQIASIALILFTSTGMTVGFHYCGKLLQDVALFGKTKPCCGEMELSGCCHNENLEIKSDDCNTSQLISNVGFIPVLICEVAFPVLDFSIHFQNSQSNFFSHLDKDRPPTTGSDIVIRVQSFLI